MKQATLKMSAVYSLINDLVDNIQSAPLHFIGRHMNKSDAEMINRIKVEKLMKDSCFSKSYTSTDVINLITDLILDDENLVQYALLDTDEYFQISKEIEGLGRVMVKGQTVSVPANTLKIVIGKEIDNMGNINRLYIRTIHLK